MKPHTLVTVFNKYPGIVVAAMRGVNPPAGMVRVEYKASEGRVLAYVPENEVKERK